MAKDHARSTHHYIKAWREHRGFTQERVAERMDMSPSNYSKLERGLIPYTQDSLEAAAHALGVDVADLLAVDPTKEGDVTLMEAFRRLPPDKKRQLTKIADAIRDAS